MTSPVALIVIVSPLNADVQLVPPAMCMVLSLVTCNTVDESSLIPNEASLRLIRFESISACVSAEPLFKFVSVTDDDVAVLVTKFALGIGSSSPLFYVMII